MYPKQPIRILIVEDEIITAMSIKQNLEKSGCEVTGIAASAKEAVAKTTDTKPDLVLMDIRLKGGIDGIATARQIQLTEDIPVIYLTAHSDPETLKRALHSKPYGYITKPFTTKQLHDTILQALEWYKVK